MIFTGTKIVTAGSKHLLPGSLELYLTSLQPVACCPLPIEAASNLFQRPATSLNMLAWLQDVDPKHPWPEYPRPQMQRPDWLNLNGVWEFEAAGCVPWGLAAAKIQLDVL